MIRWKYCYSCTTGSQGYGILWIACWFFANWGNRHHSLLHSRVLQTFMSTYYKAYVEKESFSCKIWRLQLIIVDVIMIFGMAYT